MDTPIRNYPVPVRAIKRAMEDIPEDAKLAMMGATILRILSTRPNEKTSNPSSYPTPDEMNIMAFKLQELADLWDRG